ncbi:hypothetical protein [Cylindrospermum sp. FACHB-282]|uniref:hypothetical protein n=1 Tax=Cylindrospermum sp. FACHB-282 TaxID=2692794 RepID=UPI0016841B58|nr:hypothetical protein [Cylindrospermum sp. FACHB-282]MBD2387348.1 hypothetical protein [Cylindrospermum sp. FACHB-282]
MRSSNEFKPWFPQQDQGYVAIDLVDISPQAKPIAKSTSTATKVSPKPPTTQPTLTPTLAPEPTPTSIFVPTPIPTPTPTPTPIPTPTPTPTPTPRLTPTPTPTPTPTNPVGNFPGNRRQKVVLGEGKLLPKDLPSDLANSTEETSPSPTAEISPSPTAEISPSPTAEISPSPTAEISPSPTGETSPSPTAEISPSLTGETPGSQTGTGLIAVWKILNPEEQREKRQRDFEEDLILPTISTSENKIDLTDNSSQDLSKGEFLVSLVIDNTGKCISAEVQDSAIPPEERKKLADFAKEIFQDEKFQPARFPDGKTPPPLSNLFVRITISVNQP